MPAGEIFALVLTAAVLFAVTNADDILVLTVLNASSQAGGQPRRWQIWAGQYTGFAVLVAVSVAAAAGLALVPVRWLWLLGLLPLGLGLGKLATAVRARRSGRTVPPVVVTGLAGVTGLTIANGGDNIAVYTPVFRTSGVTNTAIIIAVFMAGVALYCLASSRFAARRTVTETLRRWGQWVVPVVFIGLGCYIIYAAGTLA